MSNKLYSEESIQAIANSIRAKNGTSETYTISEMSTAISALPTNLTTKTITANGTYNASSDDADGYSSVTVAVQGYAKKSISPAPTPIATFNASALPMPSLTVGIEAVQDLHGQDYPYPAGGGKNKFPIEVNIDNKTYYNELTLNTDLLDYLQNNKGKTHIWSMTKTGTSMSGGFTIGTLAFLRNGNVITSFTPDIAFNIPTSVDFSTIDAIAIYGSPSGATIKKCQLEEGSTATSYAPYSNICPFSGFSAVNVYDTEKNLFDSNITITNNYYNDNGEEITSSTTGHSALIKVKPSTSYKVFIYAINSSQMGGKWGVYYWDSNKNFISRNVIDYAIDYTQNTIVFTTPNNCSYISFQLPIGTGVTIGGFDKTKCFLYENDTTSDFVPYNGTTTPIQFTVNGETKTVYSGYVEVINGKVKAVATHGLQPLTNWYWVRESAGGGNYRFRSMSRAWDIYEIATSNCISSAFTINRSPIGGAKVNNTLWVHTDRLVYIYCDTYTDATEFKEFVKDTQLLLPLITPIEYDLADVSISTQDGINNLWADSGDIQSGEYLEAL